MLLVDNLSNTTTCINGKWVVARPIKPGFIQRVHDAIYVISGKADAVKFYNQ